MNSDQEVEPMLLSNCFVKRLTRTARRGVMLAACIGVLGVSFPADSAAQCGFDIPAKAKKYQVSMVRAYARCPFDTPNSATMEGTPACAPPVASSAERCSTETGTDLCDESAVPLMSFDAKKGVCTFSIKSKVEDPCKTGIGQPCAGVQVKLSCKGISDGVSLIDGASAQGWELSLLVRNTLSDSSSGDVTVVDFPLVLAIPDGGKGSLKLSTTGAVIAQVLFGPGNFLPLAYPCQNVEIARVLLVEPNGAVFATPGIGSIFP